MEKIFSGTGVALVTPFKLDKSIDYKALKKIINHVSNYVDYLVLLGTTGEAAVLSENEKRDLINFVKKENRNELPIVLGIGGNNTDAVVKTLKSADLEGISGILSVAPYYNKPTQKGLYNHYKAISAASKLPIILYNVPGRTSVNISADTVLRLANDCENIVAIKEASGNFAQIMQIIKNKPENFTVLSGDDTLTLALIALGAEGVISVTANALPESFSLLVENALNGNFDEAAKYHYKILDFSEALFLEGNPVGIKAALNVIGMCANEFRSPLTRVDAEVYNKIKNELKSII